MRQESCGLRTINSENNFYQILNLLGITKELKFGSCQDGIQIENYFNTIKDTLMGFYTYRYKATGSLFSSDVLVFDRVDIEGPSNSLNI